MYLGSSKIYHDEVSSRLSYPRQARKNQVTGTSLFSFEITTEGYAENLKIIDDIGSGTKGMVESALNSVENRWIPAIVNGQAVRSMMYVAVNFQLVSKSFEKQSTKPYVIQFNVSAESVEN
jgi:outer membrane biosynthesis protein TonB